jgi:hypothetical protein
MINIEKKNWMCFVILTSFETRAFARVYW